MPVFNAAASIVANLEVIRSRIAADLGEEFEIVVVSDGSIDSTEHELLTRAPSGAFRVLHYDRNLGKGYAVKIGALEARGEWIGFVDADLDLDPSDLARYTRRAQAKNLDFAIGSKRHPDSHVHYPRSRVVASWLFQQLVRVLFRLNVRDTQVGLKLFRREIAEQVLPLLLVKRFAFDIELLAVSRAVGFDRIEEMPVTLDYRFTGSGVRSRAVLRALIDTAAIFYRLRILHYYQRQRALHGAFGWTRPRVLRPLVSVLLLPGARFRERDYPEVEVIEVPELEISAVRHAARAARGEILAILEPHARAPGNWLSATTPFLARAEVAGIVVPKMAPLHGDRRARAAAAVAESRLGAGFGFFRYSPGNVRYVRDFPRASIVVRRDAFLAAETSPFDELVAHLVANGGLVIYTPEAVVVVDPPPLFRPHLRRVLARARLHGSLLRRGELSLEGFAVGWPTALAALVVAALAAWLAVSRSDLDLAAALGAAYGLLVAVAAAAAGLRFQSAAVGALAAVGIVLTHLTYVAGFVDGIVQGSQ